MPDIKTIAFFQFFFCFTAIVSAQNNQPWKGKKCAVVLTYDDGLDVHLRAC
jgi:hypothetical protein